MTPAAGPLRPLTTEQLIARLGDARLLAELHAAGAARGAAQFAVDLATRVATGESARRRSGQMSFFDSVAADPEPPARPAVTGPALSALDVLRQEREAMDFCLACDPAALFDPLLRPFRLHAAADVAGLPDRAFCQLAGLADAVEFPTVKSGNNAGRRYARFRVVDPTGAVACLCWSDRLEWVEPALAEFAPVVAYGRVKRDPADPEAGPEVVVDRADGELWVRQALTWALAGRPTGLGPDGTVFRKREPEVTR